MLELTPRRIDLWHLPTDAVADATTRIACRQLLSPDEIQREQRFTHEQARRQFVAGRTLLRTVLSQYTGVDPGRLAFRSNAYGKPSLISPSDPPLEFNLSHTRGLAVCVVAQNDPVGVDVEGGRPRSAPLELADRFFATAEAAWLAQQPAARQPAAFLELWTLKESFIKALGVGLAMRLADFSFSLADDGTTTVSFVRSDLGQPDQWQFARLRLDSRFQVAIAIRRPASERSEVVARGLDAILRPWTSRR
ncbi:MAG: 4'-phosphopantetheinyl transferase superfamily protein [Thermoguttaceae bacterium]